MIYQIESDTCLKVLRRSVALLLILFCCCSIGCMSRHQKMPNENLSLEIQRTELSEHVRFLVQPALKGRKPKTKGSKEAREYIKKSFEASGLIPWGECKGYEQSFGLGTNIIGVLPGTDGELADEIVLVCAHYDHTGKDKEGKIHPGASDNASGVAVMLEIAESLSSGARKPKRSVCFAAFDCEEMGLLGALAFSLRDDFNTSTIAAVVNIDMLGRKFMDVVENALFVLGTENYPTLRKEIRQLSANAGVRILPVKTDVAPLMGDHTAFGLIPVPGLFFSCGVHGDLHKPTDTADKLDYAEMERHAGLITQTVEHLANAKIIEQPTPVENADRAELEALKTIFAEVGNNYQRAGITEDESKAVARLVKMAEHLLENDSYTRKNRQKFRWELAELAVPFIAERMDLLAEDATDTETDKQVKGLMLLYHYCGLHYDSVVKGYRETAQHFFRHKLNLFKRMPQFSYRALEMADEEISFIAKGGDQYRLSRAIPELGIHIPERWVVLGPKISVFVKTLYLFDYTGTRGEIADLILVSWRATQEDHLYVKTCIKLLKTVTGKALGENYDDWLKWRLEQVDSTDEKEWFCNILKSTNPYRLIWALRRFNKIVSFQEAGDILVEIIANPEIRADVRAQAMWAIDKSADNKALLVLADMLDDNAVYDKTEYSPVFDTSCPFYDHPALQLYREHIKKKHAQNPDTPKTLANGAEEKLKEITGQDFGKDAPPWRKWIENNWQ